MSEEQNMLDVTGCLPDYLRELSDKCGRLAASADFVEAMVRRESDHLLRIGELEEKVSKLAAEADRERGIAEKAASDYIDLNARYDKLVGERMQLCLTIDKLQTELQCTRDALNKHAESESEKAANEYINLKASYDSLKEAHDKWSAVLSLMVNLPWWDENDEFLDNVERAMDIMKCLGEFMHKHGIRTRESLHEKLSGLEADSTKLEDAKRTAATNGAYYEKVMYENRQLQSQIGQMKAELQGTRDALKRHSDGEVDKEKMVLELKLENKQLRDANASLSNNVASLRTTVGERDMRIDELENAAETTMSSDPIVRAVMELPTWRASDSFKFNGSETSAVIFCIKSFMEENGIDTAKELENLLETAQNCHGLKEKLRDIKDSLDDWVNEMPSVDPDDYD